MLPPSGNDPALHPKPLTRCLSDAQEVLPYLALGSMEAGGRVFRDRIGLPRSIVRGVENQWKSKWNTKWKLRFRVSVLGVMENQVEKNIDN